jgi:hypothetical protein
MPPGLRGVVVNCEEKKHYLKRLELCKLEMPDPIPDKTKLENMEKHLGLIATAHNALTEIVRDLIKEKL